MKIGDEVQVTIKKLKDGYSFDPALPLEAVLAIVSHADLLLAAADPDNEFDLGSIAYVGASRRDPA